MSLIEKTWREGMKGQKQGMLVYIPSDGENILANDAEGLSHQTCCSRRGMEGMTNGMRVVAFIGKKGSSI
ncbi:MAG: hypothetical protein WC682_00860 [Parcubacteria group bacterium]|jgi:hypothetical protein